MNDIESVKQSLRLGRYEDAIRLCNLLLEEDPKNHITLQLLLEATLNLDDLSRVLAVLPRLSDANVSDKSQPYERVVTHYLNRDKLEDAEAVYKSLIATYPETLNAYHNLGWLYSQMNKGQEAREYYLKAISLGCDGKDEVWLEVAMTYQKEGESQKAIEALDQALIVNGRCAVAKFNKATILEELGDFEGSKKLYFALAKEKRHDFNVIERLANMEALGETEPELISDAEANCQNPSLSPSQKESLHYGLGKYFDDKNEFSSAFQHYSEANNRSYQRCGAFPLNAFKTHISLLKKLDSEKVFASTLDGVPERKECPSVFVCGMFRSGSTLAEQIMSGHEALTSGGEIPFFSEVYRDQRSPYVLGSAGEHAGLQYKLQSLRDNYQIMLDNRYDTSRLVIDKRPDNIFHIGLIKSLFPDAKFVITQRDILDNMLSVYFLNLGREFPYANRISDIIDYYRLTEELGKYWQSQYPDSVFMLRYERLITEPEVSAKELFCYLGLDWQPNCLNFHESDNQVSTASLWQVRKPLYSSSVGRWKHYQQFLQDYVHLAKDHYRP